MKKGERVQLGSYSSVVGYIKGHIARECLDLCEGMKGIIIGDPVSGSHGDSYPVEFDVHIFPKSCSLDHGCGGRGNKGYSIWLPESCLIEMPVDESQIDPPWSLAMPKRIRDMPIDHSGYHPDSDLDDDSDGVLAILLLL